MKENVQIVLFFKERQVYEPLKICNSLSEKIDNLGQPIVLPFNKENEPKDKGVVVAMFNESSEINITLTFDSISFVIYDRNIDVVKKNVDAIFKVIEEYCLNITRIGYIINWFMPKSKINDFMKKNILNKNMLSADEFQLAWHEKINVNGRMVNFWQHYASNVSLSPDLFVTYDINTVAGDEIVVDREFAFNFIENINKKFNG